LAGQDGTCWAAQSSWPAFAVFHRETVIEAGGFALDTVTEDMDLIVRIRRWAVDHKRSIAMSFTSDPVCWAESPASIRMLARQRRRWQLGLCQTLWKNASVLFNAKFGVVGLLSFPFQLYVEAAGAVVELLGYALIPFAFMLGMSLPQLYLPFVILGLAYSAFLSVGSVVLEDLTHRRYPTLHDLGILIFYAAVENFGYRQLLLFYRFQGVVRFLTGFREWEKSFTSGPPKARGRQKSSPRIRSACAMGRSAQNAGEENHILRIEDSRIRRCPGGMRSGFTQRCSLAAASIWAG
jgi:hypothetical protein